jgi:hypothetical protein
MAIKPAYHCKLPTANCEKIVFMVRNHHFHQHERSELAKQST